MYPILRIGLTTGARRLICLAALSLATFAQASGVRFGIIQLDGFGQGLLVVDAPLIRGASVDIQYPGKKGGVLCCKRLNAKSFREVASDVVVAFDEVSGKPPFVYRVFVPKVWAAMPFMGVAATGKGIKSRNGVAFALLSVDAQGRRARASLCVSQEGVHLIDQFDKTERTHLYLSLGYEVEAPTCR